MNSVRISRRGFLAGSIGACLAAPAIQDPPRQARRGEGASRLGWSLALQSYTFRHLPFLEVVDLCAGLRIRHIEGWPGHPLSQDFPGLKMDLNDPQARQTVQLKLQEKRMLLSGYGVVEIPRQEEAARALFENCGKPGAMLLVTETPPSATIDKLCQEMGFQVALHNHLDSWPPEKVLEACEGLSRRVGACADTGHWVRRGLDPVETLRKLKGRIVSLHMKDLTEDKKDAVWGTGKGDVRGQLAELKAQGFRGFISIEYESSTGQELVENVRRCAEFFHRTCEDLAG